MKLQGEKMKFYIHKKFWNNIINLQEVEEKLKKFSIEMENNKFIYQNLSKGWYVKKIETNSNQLFEFRVNQSDRIMFTLNNLTIKYLCWNNHDTAVLNGKKLENLENTMFIEYHHTVKNSFKINEIFTGVTLEMNKINLKYKLPLIIDGVPGSGKTKLILDILNVLNDEMRILYISNSNKILKMENKKKLRQTTFENFLYLSDKLVNYEKFYEWFHTKSKLKMNIKENLVDLWINLNSEKENSPVEVEYLNYLERNSLYIPYHAIKLQKEKIEEFDFILCDNIELISTEGIDLLIKSLENSSYFIGVGNQMSNYIDNKKHHKGLERYCNNQKINYLRFEENLNNSIEIINFIKSLFDITIFSSNNHLGGIGVKYCIYKSQEQLKLFIKNNLTKNIFLKYDLNTFQNEKILSLENLYTISEERIICIDVLKDLKKRNLDLKRFAYLLAGKSKKELIFFETEKYPEIDVDEISLDLIDSKVEKISPQEEALKNLNKGNYKKAKALYREANDSLGEEICQAYLFYSNNKFKEALKIFKKYSSKYSLEIELCKENIIIEEKKNEFVKGMNIKEFIKNINNKNIESRFKLAKIYYSLGITRDCYEILLDLYENHEYFMGEVAWYLAYMLAKGEGTSQNLKEALHYSEKSVSQGHKDAEKLFNILKDRS